MDLLNYPTEELRNILFSADKCVKHCYGISDKLQPKRLRSKITIGQLINH